LVRNDGNGVFTSPTPQFVQNLDAPNAPQHIAIADLDGDGYKDILVGPVLNSGSVGTATYRGTATPWVFQPKVVQVFTAGALADMDGDGDADALWNKLVRNRHFHQPDCGLRGPSGAGPPG